MSFGADFDAIVGEVGQMGEVWRDGALLGRGLVFLEPAPRWEEQFVPTELGVRRREQWICYGQRAMPLEPTPGETLLKAGGRTFRVVSVYDRQAQGQRAFWVARLEWREEDAI